MRPSAAVLLLAAVALAGCADAPADVSTETMVISISDLGSGYAVGLPLWLGPQGASPEDWLQHVTVRGGNVSTSIRQLDEGPALWLQGNGRATLDAEMRSSTTGARPEAFVGGSFSMGTNGAGLPLMWVEAGDVDITWQYEANSRDCTLFLNHGWTDVQEGWHASGYDPRVVPNPQCIR